MMKRNTLLALFATGLLALAAIAIPVTAKDGEADDEDGADEHRDRRMNETAQEHREVRREKVVEARDAWKEACRDANETLNDTQQRRCMAVKEYGDHAFKARRESHALLGAIDAMERRIGRLEVREIALQAELDSGNFTGNHTAENVTAAIAKIQEHQDAIAERIAHLQERLEALHAKWAAVRDHVADRRHGGDDDEDEEDDESSSSSSSESSSTSESSSSSGSA